jgi:pilus assembly protein CpaE
MTPRPLHIGIDKTLKQGQLGAELVGLLKVAPDVVVTNGERSNPVDILILDGASQYAEDFHSAREARRSGLAEEVFLVIDKVDPDMLLKALRAGVAEILDLPLDEHVLKEALQRSVERVRPRGTNKKEALQGRVVAVVGAKSGVGTTTVAVNLAACMAATGVETAILDLAAPLGELPLFLDLDAAHPMSAVPNNLDRLDPVYLRSLTVKHETGLRLLPCMLLQDGSGRIDHTVAQRCLDTAREAFSTSVLDAGSRNDRLIASLMAASNDVLLVTHLTLPSLAGAKRIVDLFKGQGGVQTRRLRVVVNSQLDGTGIEIHEAETILGQSVDLVLPHDFKNALTALNQGTPLLHVAPKSRLHRQLQGAATSLALLEDAPKTRAGFLGGMFARKTT